MYFIIRKVNLLIALGNRNFPALWLTITCFSLIKKNCHWQTSCEESEPPRNIIMTSRRCCSYKTVHHTALTNKHLLDGVDALTCRGTVTNIPQNNRAHPFWLHSSVLTTSIETALPPIILEQLKNLYHSSNEIIFIA